MLQCTCWLTQRLTKSMASRSSICQTSSSSSCQQTPQTLRSLLIRASLRAPRRTIAGNLCSGSLLKMRSLKTLASCSKSCGPTSTRWCAGSTQHGRIARCLRPFATAGTKQASCRRAGLQRPPAHMRWLFTTECAACCLISSHLSSGTTSSAACLRLCS
jgi:hypothetical protein